MKSVILFFVMLLAMACKSHKKNGEETVADSSPMVMLETSPCRGFCPVFKITVKNDGQAEYEGIRFVRQIGLSKFSLTTAELEGLKKMLQEVNLWQYPESFPVTIADAAGASITIYKGSETKTIRGSVERPKPIRDVEEHLKSLAKAHGYNLESLDPNAIADDAPKKELLVKLKSDVNAGNWLNAFNQSTKANLRLLKRVSADNIWVVVYDASKHSAGDLLTLLKSNESVIEAQENKEAQERGKN